MMHERESVNPQMFEMTINQLAATCSKSIETVEHHEKSIQC